MPIVAEASTAMAKSQKKTLVVEDYLDFIDDRARDLTATQLSQIIAMHGFKKMSFKKSSLIEMVATMNLMDLGRSTLLDGAVSGGARFTLEEVKKDLKDLDWQECHISSVITHGAGVSASAATAPLKRKRRKRSSGKKAVGVGGEISAMSSGTTVAAGSTAESLRSVDCCYSLALVSRPPSPVAIAPVKSIRKRRRVKKSKKLDEIVIDV